MNKAADYWTRARLRKFADRWCLDCELLETSALLDQLFSSPEYGAYAAQHRCLGSRQRSATAKAGTKLARCIDRCCNKSLGTMQGQGGGGIEKETLTKGVSEQGAALVYNSQ